MLLLALVLILLLKSLLLVLEILFGWKLEANAEADVAADISA